MNPVIIEDFPRIRQAELQWCWAAVSASIYNYYGDRPCGVVRPPRPQCAFVADFVGSIRCECRRKGQPVLDACQRRESTCSEALEPQAPDAELKRYGLLECIVTRDGTIQRFHRTAYNGGLDQSMIKDNIDDGRPVVLRTLVGHRGREKIHHAIVIIGYYPWPSDMFVIWDPFTGERHLTMEQVMLMFGPIVQLFLTRQATPGTRSATRQARSMVP